MLVRGWSVPGAVPATQARQLRCAAADGGPSPNNLSRRRSQRLRQPRDAGARDLQRQLREREARLEELQRRQQQEQEQQQQQQDGTAEPEGLDEAAPQQPELTEAQQQQEAATRSLLTQLGVGEQGRRDGAPAAGRKSAARDPNAMFQAAVQAVAGPLEEEEDAGAAAAPAPPPPNVVEPDFILEQQGAQAVGEPRPVQAPPAEFSRQSEALIAIIQAGERVEEVIAERRADIDETMLKLLKRRIGAAQQMERRSEVIQGLQLLYRRLKAEVDRQQASPALRLLDELMSVLDPGEADTLSGSVSKEERRQQAAARARAAFSGGLAGGADVLSLAAQLSGAGGEQLADELVADPVDPAVFMAETTQLLGRVEQQVRQAEAYLAQLRRQWEEEEAAEAVLQGGELGNQGGQHSVADQLSLGSDEAQAREQEGEAAEEGEEALTEEQQARRKQQLELEGAVEQRRAAASLVQECLEVAEAVMRQLQLQGL